MTSQSLTTDASAAAPPRRHESVGRHGMVALTVLVLALGAPFVGFYEVFLMKVLCFALFAAAFNLLLGFTGLLSFGHAAYFGFAAYVCGHAVKEWAWTPELGILLGVLVAALMGLVIGGLAIRRQGIYFAMITLAFAQMVYFISNQSPFTGGEDGIQAIPRGMLFGLIDLSVQQDAAIKHFNMYYFVLAIVGCGFLFIYRVIHSPFGQVLKSIRENEQRAISLGYSTDRYKLLAFVISAALAGLAGATKALVFQVASLTDVQWQMSGEVVLMTLIGGVGTIWGPAVGALVIVSMQNYFAGFGQFVLMAQGLIFVICVLVFRRGIVGEAAALLRGRAAWPSKGPAA